MNNVAEFIEARQGIESLAKEIAVLVGRKTMPESKIRLDEALEMLAKLTTLADNDVQDNAVIRLTHLLGGLQAKIGALAPKKRVVKAPAIPKAPATS
jgi:hypothetical protein